ncbi:MAG: prepilin-type N-terminal cleavage/methylation domain-containing protein [bacterium]
MPISPDHRTEIERNALQILRLVWIHPALKAHGFTLIELLVVVAIISILASIAVPNFLDAQVRAKVARVQADMRSLSVAVESYAVDHTSYPYRQSPLIGGARQPVPPLTTRIEQMSKMTSPLSYITSLPTDIFDIGNRPPVNLIDYYDPEQTRTFVAGANFQSINTTPNNNDYLLVSVGPDGFLGLTGGSPLGYPREGIFTRGSLYNVYDPTNGTIHPANIFRFRGQENPWRVLNKRRL